MILITSAVEREGKSTTVSNLAVAFARAGRRVALVDFDLRRPTVSGFFDISGSVGVVDVIRGVQDLGAAMVEVNVATIDRPSLAPVVASAGGNGHVHSDHRGSLAVLPSGSATQEPAELASSPGAGWVLRALAERYDLVLVDTPPALPVSDAVTLMTHADALVVVTKMGEVTTPALYEFRKFLTRLRRRLWV